MEKNSGDSYKYEGKEYNAVAFGIDYSSVLAEIEFSYHRDKFISDFREYTFSDNKLTLKLGFRIRGFLGSQKQRQDDLGMGNGNTTEKLKSVIW